MIKKEKKSLFEADISFGGISLLQKAIFAKNLALMLKSGLNIVEALEIIENQATGRFKTILSDVLCSVEAGNSLSSALGKYPKEFSEMFLNTTKAGESAGTLAENLENIADHLRKNNELVSKIKGAMIYPIIVIFGAFILGVVLSFVVLPKIIPLFENLKVDLPLTTRLLIYFTHFIQAHKASLLFGIFFGSIFFFWFIKQKFSQPITHYLLLKIPIIKRIVINSNLANFCNTFGMLLKSGLIIDEALLVAKDVVGNHYFKKSLDDVYKRTMQGNKLSDNLERYDHLYPKMVISMVRVGEKSGDLENSLFHLGNFYESEVDIAAKSLSTAIEPILLIVIGAVVGGLAISIITPIYKLTGNVSK